MPKWVSALSLDYVMAFLKTGQLRYIDKDETLVQKLLWLSDFLHLDQFQSIFIEEKAIPMINHSNSLRFLVESFKKLKHSSKCSETWYSLFNYSVDTTARHLIWNRNNNNNELLNINPKILEEVIERAFVLNKNLFQTDNDQILSLLKDIRKKDDIFELLVSQRQVCQQKKFSNFI